MPRVELLPWQRWMLVAGTLLTALALIALAVGGGGGLAGWLGAAIAFSAIPAGSTYLVLMMRLIPGAWGEELRLSAEAATVLTPLGAILFLPVLLAPGALYPWAQGHSHSPFQSHYMTPFLFAARTVLRFAALWWISRRMRMRRATGATAAGGIIVLPLLASMVSVDWLMSLDPRYASSAFGLQFLTREISIGFCAILLLRLSVASPPRHVQVAGGILLTLILIWAYIEYIPFFVAWSPNLPDDAAWYLRRAGGGWAWVIRAFAIAGGVPLALLLFAPVRKSAFLLKPLAALVLVGKALELAWLSLPGESLPSLVIYLAALVGLCLVASVLLPLSLRTRVAARMPARPG